MPYIPVLVFWVSQVGDSSSHVGQSVKVSSQLAVVQSWDPSMSPGGAGCTAVLCTYPLDLARARMVGGPVTDDQWIMGFRRGFSVTESYVRNDPEKRGSRPKDGLKVQAIGKCCSPTFC